MFKILVITVASKLGAAAPAISTQELAFDEIGIANVAFERLARTKAVHDVHCVVTVTSIKLY